MLFENERCIELARYVIDTGCTVRSAAEHFGISKSTVHKDITKVLPEKNSALAAAAAGVLAKNRMERHLRGGEATKLKYKNLKEIHNIIHPKA